MPALPPPPAVESAAPPRSSPVAGFFFDLLVGAGTVLGLSLLCSLAWGLWRAFQVGLDAARTGTTPPAAADMAQLLGQPGALTQLLIALVSTGGAALLLYSWRRPADFRERKSALMALRRPSTWGWTLLVAACVFAGTGLIGWGAGQLGIKPLPTNQPLMEQALVDFPVFLLVFAVLLAPAYEELLFRRVLFGRLCAAGRPMLGIVLSSAAFALMHEMPGASGNGPAEILQLWLIYGGMGAAFAWLYRRTGTLWAAIAAHGINNAIALVALVLSAAA